jgi:hypothetical protein
MENNNFMNDDWVDRQLASLPMIDREPNAARGLAILKSRERHRRGWILALATASVSCVALLALPGTKAFAQRLWDSLFLTRAEVVRVSFEDVPQALSADILRGGAGPEGVRDIDEAERKAGFRPIIPRAGILSSAPSFSVSETLEARLMLRRADLLKALQKAGVSNVDVPVTWDGAPIGARVGPVVVADYGQATVLQCKSIMLVVPPGFDTPRFVQVALRILGADEREARRMSDKFAANPAWFWGIPRDKQATIQEVSLASGHGVYIEEFDTHGVREGAAVIWNTPDRTYLVGGRISRELAMAVANSIP